MSETQEIINYLRSVDIDGKPFPRKIQEIEELKIFDSFDSLITKIKAKSYQVIIPDQYLYSGGFDIVGERDVYKRSNQILRIPLVVAVLISILGVVVGQYWLLLALPTIYATQFLSGIIGRPLLVISAIGGSVFIAFQYFTMGILSFLVALTVFTGFLFRQYRKNHMLKQVLSNEEMFCATFYNRAVQLFDVSHNTRIVSTS